MKRFAVVILGVLCALGLSVGPAAASSTKFVFWNVRGVRNCSSPGVCSSGHEYNHAVTPHLFSIMGSSPDLISLGAVELCQVDFDNFRLWFGPGTGKNMQPLNYHENDLSGTCTRPGDPEHDHNQWFGDAVFSIGTANVWVHAPFANQMPNEDPRGYACLDMTIFVVRLYQCVTHLVASNDTIAVQQLTSMRNQLWSHSARSGGPLPVLLMDANLETYQDTSEFSYLQNGTSSEAPMTDLAMPPCPSGISYLFTCLTPTWNGGKKIDYLWIASALSPVQGVTDSSTWSPLENDSDHSVLYGKF